MNCCTTTACGRPTWGCNSGPLAHYCLRARGTRSYARAVDILTEVPNLVRRYRHGDAFRHYVRERRPLVLAALLIFSTISLATTSGMVVYIGGTNALVVLLCLLAAPLVLIGSALVQAYIFFSWLEGRALGSTRPVDVPWTAAFLFVAVPFFVLALLSLKLACTLLVIAIFTPVAYALIDS